MRRSSLAVVVVSLAGVLVASSSVAHAGEAQTATPLGTASFAVDDGTFEVSGCLEVPLSLTMATTSSDVSWNAQLEARLEGTATTSSAFLYGSGSGREDDNFLICPNLDGAGRWLVTGEITMRNYDIDAEYEASLSTSFVVSKARTAISISKISATSYYMEVTGKVTSRSAQWGTVGVSGSVSVQLRKGPKWVEVGTGFADNRGVYTATVFETYPRKSTFRAVYKGDSSTLASTSAARRY